MSFDLSSYYTFALFPTLFVVLGFDVIDHSQSFITFEFPYIFTNMT